MYDLSNPWEPDNTASAEAVVKVTKTSGQVISTKFPVLPDPFAANVSPVDSSTTARLYVFDDPNLARDFVEQAMAGERNYSIGIEISVPISQNDCYIPSGEYINHLRYSDSLGVTYVDSFNFSYNIPANFQGSNPCEQATITIE